MLPFLAVFGGGVPGEMAQSLVLQVFGHNPK